MHHCLQRRCRCQCLIYRQSLHHHQTQLQRFLDTPDCAALRCQAGSLHGQPGHPYMHCLRHRCHRQFTKWSQSLHGTAVGPSGFEISMPGWTCKIKKCSMLSSGGSRCNAASIAAITGIQNDDSAQQVSGLPLQLAKCQAGRVNLYLWSGPVYRRHIQMPLMPLLSPLFDPCAASASQCRKVSRAVYSKASPTGQTCWSAPQARRADHVS